jgi:glycosyltransferase involved in cell wall biosynthesis
MKGKLLVSIIIPVYNSGRTLAKSIESIMRQTYDNWEIIIVDSYSNDNTRKIALEYQKKLGNNRCRYYNIREVYQSKKFNYGVQVSKGDRIYLQGSDQYLTPKVLEECVKVANEGYDAVGVPVKFIIPKKYFEKCIYYSYYFLNSGKQGLHYPNFIKKAVWANLGGLDESIWYLEDLDFYIRFKKAGYTLKPINAVSLHDQSYTLRSMIFKTKAYNKGMQSLIKKDVERARYANRYLEKSITYYIRSFLSWSKSNPKYAMGVLFAIFIRYIVKFFFRLSRSISQNP